MVLAGFALFSPIWPGAEVVAHIGLLTVFTGLIEIYHGFRRNTIASRRTAMYSGAFSMLIGFLLINSKLLQLESLQYIIAAIFLVESLRYFRNYLKYNKPGRKISFDLLACLGNLILVIGIFFFTGKGIQWVLSVIMAARMVGIGLGLLAAQIGTLDQVSEDIVRDLGLEKYSQLPTLAQAIEDDETNRAPYDRQWIIIFLIVLFFIHLGRMGLDRSSIAILSPLVALLGDIVVALIISYAIIWPLRMSFKKLSGWIDRSLWAWVMQSAERKGGAKWLEKFVQVWLTKRMRTAIQFRKAGYSFRTALRTGLRIGLPWSALLAAIMPVLGMSWYFDTENWASGIWDRWAAIRTDNWRMAMVQASGENILDPKAFNLAQPDVADTADFSFVVIGDPGEGDASQLVLKDQILKVTNKPDVRFLVVSSDIVYPSGALRDYEKKFWMPFKGVEKPVYAIPGNHDWYDALDGFTTTFFEPDAAKKALRARVHADLDISSTTDKKINEMIAKTDMWRQEYGVPTGYQKAPFFQVANGNFVLITLETGIERQIDSLQMTWLQTVLEASKDKFVMVLLGHPFYAIGEYQGNMNPRFEALHKLLRTYKVPLIMAGDTHDLEYYIETEKNNDGHTMHHFVNGGGGAYLSIGTAMADPGKMPTADYAFFPAHKPLVKKIDDLTAWYKYPAWWYTKKFNGWPFSAEWLSAAFDYNQAPFFQSFMEIRVERSQNRIRLIPYSNKGRLKWTDITSVGAAGNVEKTGFVEWLIPIVNNEINK
jgi:uncharacterized membrane protein HdeD (DUF308 family)/3',5'-cyclic AMP phosphodiesterase CpdA